jgi:tRNA/rRNA methyltransferase
VWQPPRFAPATTDEIEALYAHGQITLAAMRFLDPKRPKRLLPRLRRLFARAGLEREEVNILRGSSRGSISSSHAVPWSGGAG